MENYKHLIEMMRSFDTAMLVSRSEAEMLRARPMAVAELVENGEIWFLTDKHSGKIDEIQRDPRTAVIFQNRSQFVSLSGRSRIVENRAKVHELWSESWKVWFPAGKDDPTIMLVHFIPDEAEFWDNAGIRGLRYLFKAGVAYLQGQTPEVDDANHAKLKV